MEENRSILLPGMTEHLIIRDENGTGKLFMCHVSGIFARKKINRSIDIATHLMKRDEIL